MEEKGRRFALVMRELKNMEPIGSDPIEITDATIEAMRRVSRRESGERIMRELRTIARS